MPLHKRFDVDLKTLPGMHMDFLATHLSHKVWLAYQALRMLVKNPVLWPAARIFNDITKLIIDPRLMCVFLDSNLKLERLSRHVSSQGGWLYCLNHQCRCASTNHWSL